jgi:SpoVK/Ycf46/Vps4 family AAA+-type ATPase
VKEDLFTAVNDPMNGIASLEGREKVMNVIAGTIDAFSRNYRVMTNKFSHMVIMGPSGCGKTKIANTIAFVLAKAGLLLQSDATVVTRADLVGQYVGQTAPLTRMMLSNTFESVLFIDEAYELARNDSGRDFGKEAITEIVFFLDKYQGCNLVIAAGYEEPMRNYFLGANEGMNRRFPHQILLAPYDAKALTEILLRHIKGLGMVVTSNTRELISKYVANLHSQNAFTNQAADMIAIGDEIFATSLRDTEPWSFDRAKLIVKDVVVQFLHRKGFVVTEMKVTRKEVGRT